MNMAQGLASREASEGGWIAHRRKRVKSSHNARDQILANRQAVLGSKARGEPNGTPAPRAKGHTGPNHEKLAQLPPVNLKLVPAEPEPQALWIARELKKLSGKSMGTSVFRTINHGRSTISPTSPTFSLGSSHLVNGDRTETPENGLKNSRYSGRMRKQTSKAKDLHLADNELVDIDEVPIGGTCTEAELAEGKKKLSALLLKQEIREALASSIRLGPGNFVKRREYGELFLQSLVAPAISQDEEPAARLKLTLWRSRKGEEFITALQILAGFEEVLEAIDLYYFRGRVDNSIFPVNDSNQPNGNAQIYAGTSLIRSSEVSDGPQANHYAQPIPQPRPNQYASSSHYTQSNHYAPSNPYAPSKHYSEPDRSAPAHRPARSKVVKLSRKAKPLKPSVPPNPSFLPGLVSEVASGADVSLQADDEMSFGTENPEEEASESEASRQLTLTSPADFPPIDPVLSACSIASLNGAVAILDDMAYGALRFYPMPPLPEAPNNQYLSPYGPPGPNTYVTPYANPPPPPPERVHQVNGGSQSPENEAGGLSSGTSMSTKGPERQGDVPLSEEAISLEPIARQPSLEVQVKEKGKSREPAPGPNDVLETTETDKITVREAKSTLETSNDPRSSKGVEDSEIEYTQEHINSFLALAALVESDDESDDDTDRDKTISREMTPVVAPPGDPALESIVQGIIGELQTNQNWGHGIGFLTPQTHLYQISNAPRFAMGLRECIDDATLEVNCIVSPGHSRALTALYERLVKRISNPYLDGTLPHYTNVVYHNGRAYQAIPGPAHPMYQQQLPYPPPPPPSHQLLPSQGHPSMQPMTPPGSARVRPQSSLPTSTKEKIRMIREYGVLPPPPAQAPQSDSSQFPSRSDSHHLPVQARQPMKNLLHGFVSSESDLAPIVAKKSANRPRKSILPDYVSSESDHTPAVVKKSSKRKRASS